MSADAEDITLIEQALSEAGLSVQRLAETSEPTCDLQAGDPAGERYLIEVKALHDDADISPTLRRGEMYEKTTPMSRSARVDTTIDKAIGQLEATSERFPDSLRLLAFVVRSKLDAKVKYQQLMGELCGKRSLTTRSSTPGKSDHHECYYFAHSAFFQHRNAIDGAITFYIDGFTLFVNDHSARADRIRNSVLGRFFHERRAMMDNAALTRDGFLIADCDLDRNDEPAMIRWVASRYGLDRPVVMDFKRFSAIVSTGQ